MKKILTFENCLAILFLISNLSNEQEWFYLLSAESRRLVQAGGSVKTSHLGTLYLKVAGPAMHRAKRCGGVTGQEYNVGWYRVNNAPAGMIRQGF